MSARHGTRLRWHGVFGLPIVIGLASTAGLIAGLMGDGGWDLLAWVGLILPCFAIPATMRRRTRR